MATYSKMSVGSFLVLLALTGCSSMSNFMGAGNNESEVKPIENPFGNFEQSKTDNITYRSRTGDRSVEVEIPNQTDVDMPMNVKREERKADGIDYRYQEQKATMTDREIADSFSKQANPQDEANRNEIEQSLGLRKSDETPSMEESYLAKMDVVKQLFTTGRHEAALLELDSLIKTYPTNARLYEMRGTVLDRMGYTDMAIRSWKQALEFEPQKVSLKKIIDKREQQRSVASGRK